MQNIKFLIKLIYVLLHHNSKCHPALFVVLEAQGAAVEADDLA